MGNPAQPVKHDETKTESRKDRFKRLAGARTNAVLRKLKVLGNCANKAAYEYTRDEVEKIFKALDAKVREVKSRFFESSGDDTFKF